MSRTRGGCPSRAERRCSWAMLLVLPLLLSGCIAGVKAGQVSADNADVGGLRYFLPAQYLVIEQTADGQWDAHFQSVVDRSREYFIQPYVYLGSGKATATFNDDGTLKSFKLVSDTTGVPAEVITAVKDVQLKREELTRTGIEAKKEKDAGFSAVKPPIASAESHRDVYLFRIDGDKLHGVTQTPAASLAFASKQPSAPAYDLPVSLSPRLEISPSDVDPKTQLVVGERGQELTRDEATADRLCFYAAIGGKYEEVSPARKAAIFQAAKTMAGRLVFTRTDLWDVAAIGFAKQSGGVVRCQPA